MLSRTHCPQKVLPITHNKTHTHSTSDITFLSSPLLFPKQKRKIFHSFLFLSLYNQPMENYSFWTFTSYLESGESSSIWFMADFGLFRFVSTVLVSGQYDSIRPIRLDFGRISANWSRVGMNLRKKKKKIKRGIDVRAAASGHVGLRCGILPAVFVLHSESMGGADGGGDEWHRWVDWWTVNKSVEV